MPRLLYNWKLIQEYHDLGHGFVECQKRFGFSHTAWVKAIKTGKLRTTDRDFRDRRCRYDWAEIQAYYDAGNSYRECQARFGFNPMSWHKARLRGEIKTRPLGMPFEQLLVSNGGSRRNVKYRLLRSGMIINRCDHCGLREWRGKPLAMHLDHINGVRDDHRLENLRMLCPNCHSQTDTYGAKNKGRQKALQDPSQAV
jgi:5-methylcytosine-specific restriction endonuclease McrA